MTEPSIDHLLLKAKNKFLLSNATGERAKQILSGSLPYVDNFDPASPIMTALKEISAGKIKIKPLKEPLKEKVKIEEERELTLLERLEKRERKKYRRK